MTKQYIGDGCYVEMRGTDIVLTTSNGIEDTNTIVLEPIVYAALYEYVDRIRKQERLRGVQLSLKERLGRPEWLRGIGLSRDSVEVRVKEITPEIKALIPDMIAGVPINIEAVGDIVAFAESSPK